MWLFAVFISAFGAATILPLSSEITVIAAYTQGESPYLIWFLASVGNVLGALVNYGLGRYFLHFKDSPWFPFKSADISRASQWFQRYGVWSLLGSWLPIVGDALTIIAGATGVRLMLFLILVSIGKSLRYAALILTLMQPL